MSAHWFGVALGTLELALLEKTTQKMKYQCSLELAVAWSRIEDPDPSKHRHSGNYVYGLRKVIDEGLGT